MITNEEKESIINEAVERALLRLPDVIGNLITSHIHSIKLNRQFYDKFPNFRDAKDLVTKIVEKLESNNPGVDYSVLLDKAVPLIKEQLKTLNSLDLKSVNRPNRDLSKLIPSGNNGEL